MNVSTFINNYTQNNLYRWVRSIRGFYRNLEKIEWGFYR